MLEPVLLIELETRFIALSEALAKLRIWPDARSRNFIRYSTAFAINLICLLRLLFAVYHLFA
jgi:hypothetical protein